MSPFVGIVLVALTTPAAHAAECEDEGPFVPSGHPCCEEPLWVEFQWGDVNDDGSLDISDVFLVGAVLSYDEPNPYVVFLDVWEDLGVVSLLADTNGDGWLRADDFEHLVGYLFEGSHDEPETVCAAPISASIG